MQEKQSAKQHVHRRTSTQGNGTTGKIMLVYETSRRNSSGGPYTSNRLKAKQSGDSKEEQGRKGQMRHENTKQINEKKCESKALAFHV